MRVAPSPFNPVKLELGVILVVGVLLVLVQGRLNLTPLTQLLVLLIYGVLGAVWVIVRTRRILRQRDRTGGNLADGSN